ncbi:MAG TPA: nicotinate phosphoribosyltransferase [Myxococcales bacterium]|nr:nicotinate phosphoribosyltransferase [Myxococcales bacterium]
MHIPSELYRPSLALVTDLYQLTMAYAYWKSGMDRLEAAFHLSFRRNPFQGGFTVACGLEYAIDWIESLRFDGDDLAYLAEVRGSDGAPLFDRAFLDHLAELRFSCDVDGVPEGTLVFPLEPMVRVAGPILQCQLLETALLNAINFQSLVATKAARVVMAARGDPVLEFGLRRAQGFDGALSASRAAWIGGCAATSNVLAGRIFGIPVSGTHGHSWVMAFGDELTAFRAYAEALPNNCVFLVDTYDSREGVRHAIRVGKELRARGHEMLGIRLDSGDLAWLSTEARKALDAAGFPGARIVASNELDEHLVTSLKEQGAGISSWGIGTRLVTAHDDPALGGVYKLSAVRERSAAWRPKIKLSEQPIKTSIPGVLQVRRFRSGNESVADAIYDEDRRPQGAVTIVDPLDPTRRRTIAEDTPFEDLLVPIFRGGRRVYDPPPLNALRRRTSEELTRFHAGVKRFVNPHRYPVGLERELHELRTRLILEARERVASGA